MHDYVYTAVRPNVWQIEDELGVRCTLIKGSTMALFIDTGFGNYDLRSFVEANITTPYMVVNTHGHPDHCGGNHWFDTVWAAEEEWDVIRFSEKESRSYKRKNLEMGKPIHLGDLTVTPVPLIGHTKGSTGFLIREWRLLISGDAISETLWLFGEFALSRQQLRQTIQSALEMDFDTYLCGHTHEECPKEKLRSHLQNIDSLTVDPATMRRLHNFETYRCVCRSPYEKSAITFTLDRL